MIEKIAKYVNASEIERVLMKIFQWNLKSSGNTLKTLCEMDLELTASKFLKDFHKDSTAEFFYYCLFNVKDIFLKYNLDLIKCIIELPFSTNFLIGNF